MTEDVFETSATRYERLEKEVEHARAIAAQGHVRGAQDVLDDLAKFHASRSRHERI